MAVTQLADHLKLAGVVAVGEVTGDHVRGFILEMMETRSAATAHQRHRSLAGFLTWLTAEEEIETNVMKGLKPPQVPSKAVDVVSERGFELTLANL